MINCKEASRLLSQARERPLDREERADLRLHLLRCNMCRDFNRQLDFINAAMRQYAE